MRIFPQPVQAELPTCITYTGGVERFEQARALGANILTALLFQDTDELAKLTAHRRAGADNGHTPSEGQVTLMLHTHLGGEEVQLWRRGSPDLDVERQSVLDHAFSRYYRTSGPFGTEERAANLVERLAAIGVHEIACLVDFGLQDSDVLSGLEHLARLRRRHSRPTGARDRGPRT